MGEISRREFIEAASVSLGLPSRLLAQRWNPVAGSLNTKFTKYDSGRSYFASQLPDDAYAAEIISAREIGKPRASIEDFLYHRSERYGRTPDIVLSGGNHDWNPKRGFFPDALYIRNGKVQQNYRNNDLYNGVLYADSKGQLHIAPLTEFQQRMNELNPADALQVELLRFNNVNMVPHNSTAAIEEPRHFMSQGKNLTYSVVMADVGFTNQWIDWVASSFDAEKVIALRGGHGAQARDWLGGKSPDIGGKPQDRLLVNAIAIYNS